MPFNYPTQNRLRAMVAQSPQMQMQDYVTPAFKQFSQGQQMGRQMDVNKLAGRYLMSGGMDKQAAQELAMKAPDVFANAENRLIEQKKTQQQQQMDIATKGDEFLREALLYSGQAPTAEAGKAVFAEAITQNPLARQVFSEQQIAQFVEGYDEDDYLTAQRQAGVSNKALKGTPYINPKTGEKRMGIQVGTNIIDSVTKKPMDFSEGWQPQIDTLTEKVDAKAREVELVGDVKARQKASDDVIKTIPAIQTNIDLYDQAINAIEDDAETGRIATMFPSFSEATNRLMNIQNQLGLNRLSTVTLGAVSEKEMDILMQTEIPTNMDEDELKGWLSERKQAEQKYLRAMQDYAMKLQTMTPIEILTEQIAKERDGKATGAGESGGAPTSKEEYERRKKEMGF